MSVANKKGGYYRTIEINRDDSNTSETVLTDAFLTKTDNYLVQVSNFVNSNTQPLNTLNEAMFTIKQRGSIINTPDNMVALPVDIGVFRPTSYFSVLELARQLDKYCKRATEYIISEDDLEEDDDVIDFDLNANGTFSFTLYPNFSNGYYIEVGSMTQKMTGFRQYIFIVNSGAADGDIINSTDITHLHLIDVHGMFTYHGSVELYSARDDHTLNSERALSTFDTRLSLDVVALGFPISTKPSILDGKESNNYVLARFPTSDYQKIESELGVTDGDIEDTTILIEQVNIGLEDLTRNNTEVIANHMFNGTIQHCNFRLESRYFFDGKIETVPTDVKHGFFSLKLLFSKKIT